MAEEEKRKVKYNNQEFSEDFIGFSSKYADAYTQYKKMNPAQRSAFMKALQDRHSRMLNGEDGYVDEDDVMHTGIFTGREKDDAKNWLGMDRDPFNISREVNDYLMGMSGKIASKRAELAQKAKQEDDKSTWIPHKSANSKSTLAGLISSKTGPDLVAWADLVQDFEDENGVRPITARRGEIKKILQTYADDLREGKYGDINDPDRKTELEYIDEILKDNGADPRVTEALYKRLLTGEGYDKLFFTGKKYQTEEEAKAAKEEADANYYTQWENDYVQGKRPDSPYDPNGSAEQRAAYLRAEERKTQYQEYQRQQEFNNLSYDYVPNSPTFTTSVINLDNPSVYENVQIENLLDLIQRAENLKTDDEGYDVFDKNYFSQWNRKDWSGYGKDDEKESLEYLSPYFNTINKEPDDVYNNSKAKTNAAWLGQYALNMIYNKMGSNNLFGKYRLKNGDYLIPELVDWNTGRAYTMGLKGNLARLNKINITQLMQDLAQDNALRLQLENLWRKFKGYGARQVVTTQQVPSAAEGRKLTQKEKENLALPGAPTVYQPQTAVQEEVPTSDAAQEYYNEAVGRGTSGQQRWLESQRKPGTLGDENFTVTEGARLGAAAADIAGAIAAWVPGYGTATSAALGLGSTATNLFADWTDESVSGLDMAKDLGLNLAFDVVGLFSGVGMEAKGLKVVNSLRKFAPKIMYAATALAGVHGGYQMIQALDKALNTNEKLTVEDWKNVAYALSALAGTSRVGASAMKTRRFKNKLQGEATTEKAHVNSNGQKVSDADVKRVQQAKTKEEYEKAYEQVFGAKPKDGFVRGSGNRFMNLAVNRFKNNAVPEKQIIPTANAAGTFEARQQALNQALADENALKERHPIMSKLFNTDLDIHARQTGFLRQPFSEKRGTRRNLQGELDAEKQQHQEQVKKQEEAAKSSKRKHKVDNVREKQLIKEVDQLLESKGAEKIKDRKAFIDYIRKNIKSKKLKEQKAAIENLSAEDLVKLRETFKFKEGGKVQKYWDGGWLKNIGKALASSDGTMSAIETGKLIYANDISRRNTRMLKDVPPLQYSAGIDIPNTISTNNIEAPYNEKTSQTESIAGNLSKQYATSELQAAARLAGHKQAMQYQSEKAEALRNQMTKANEDNMKIAQYNTKVHNEIANQNNQLRMSKKASDADLQAKSNQFINGQVQKYLETVSLGVQASKGHNWEIARNSALNNDPYYRDLMTRYTHAKKQAEGDLKNEEYKKNLTDLSKELSTYITNFNTRYEAENPRPATRPFARYTPGYIFEPSFYDSRINYNDIPSNKEGGSIGKMTQAELVKLFRDREKRKFKDRESQRKYMDKFSERMHRANNSIAYQAYIKLLNSK